MTKPVIPDRTVVRRAGLPDMGGRLDDRWHQRLPLGPLLDALQHAPLHGEVA
jgi:hypothetical protein